jgi:hypothetical protein
VEQVAFGQVRGRKTGLALVIDVAPELLTGTRTRGNPVKFTGENRA